METCDDIGLVKRSAEGDKGAFAHLVNRHYTAVYRVSYRWCGLRQDAEDITQDVFVKVARKLNTFNRKSAFKTWLYRITINTAKDFHRKRAVRHSHEAAAAFEQALGNPSPPTDEHLDAVRLHKALDSLPDKQKSAILLVFAEGLTHREAAQALNCSETTISWRIFKARKRLKQLMEEPEI